MPAKEALVGRTLNDARLFPNAEDGGDTIGGERIHRVRDSGAPKH